MKYIVSLFLFVSSITCLKSQTFNQSNIQQPTCYGACNGSVTYTTSGVTGPFTAVLTNSASCPNSTLSSSSSSAITVNSICACASTYTVAVYTGTILAGVNYVQFPNFATAPLTVVVSSVVAASCATCCNGSAYITWSGGNTTFSNTPPMFTIDGVATSSYSPAPGLCPGSHTVCAKDSSHCVACKSFSIAGSVPTGIRPNVNGSSHISLFPNPVSTDLTIESGVGGSITRAVVIDPTGRVILEYRFDISPQNKVEINVSSLAEGVYYIQVYGPQNTAIQRSRFAKKDN